MINIASRWQRSCVPACGDLVWQGRLFHSESLAQPSWQACLGAVQRDCQWPLKMVEIPSYRSCKPSIHSDIEPFPNIYLEQLITKVWCQATGGHVSHSSDSPTSTRLGLCTQEWQSSDKLYFYTLSYSSAYTNSTDNHTSSVTNMADQSRRTLIKFFKTNWSKPAYAWKKAWHINW